MIKVNQALIFISKPLFSYQMAFVVKPMPTVSHLLDRAKLPDETPK
jgi:hypothetical protein